MAEEPSFSGDQEDRRRFLKTCGRFAATVPPAMTVLLSTSLSSKAIAKSTGGGGGADRLAEAVPPAMAIMLGEANDKSSGGDGPLSNELTIHAPGHSAPSHRAGAERPEKLKRPPRRWRRDNRSVPAE